MKKSLRYDANLCLLFKFQIQGISVFEKEKSHIIKFIENKNDKIKFTINFDAINYQFE